MTLRSKAFASVSVRRGAPSGRGLIVFSERLRTDNVGTIIICSVSVLPSVVSPKLLSNSPVESHEARIQQNRL